MVRKLREYIAACPGCLTWETIWFDGRRMEPKSKFTRELDGKVYHDCELTDKPCRLYPRFIEEKCWV